MMGRLSRPPHPVLFERLYEPQMAHAPEEVLPFLLAIDAVHVVMLAERGLLACDTAAALLRVNTELSAGLARGEPVLPPPETHRGVYYVYEREYVRRLGETIGGAAHLARSRNDINATLTRMRLRGALLDTLDRATGLATALAGQAATHAETVMSGFTHLQPAQPTTLGHYLAGVCFALLRDVEWLDRAYDGVNRSPMGAAAGYGTSFAIDPSRVADLLGFREAVENSLDAVASRDYVVHVLHGLAMLGITMTRLATDLQTWSSAAYGFIGWPDDFVSTSSIMPQKRNAFVLENVRGRCSRAPGGLVAALLGMKNVPFANSVEVSAEATAHVWPALADTDAACDLLALLVRNVETDSGRALEFARASEIGTTALADRLVIDCGLPFRTAHEVVSRAVADVSRSDEPLLARVERALGEATGVVRSLDTAALARTMDPDACVRAAGHGGGPSPAGVREQLDRAAARVEQMRQRSAARRSALAAADGRRLQAVAAIRETAARRVDRDVPNRVCD